MDTSHSAELATFMDNLQRLALQSSTLSSNFVDALNDCREECASAVQDLFAKDFDSLMNDPVETLTLNVTPTVDAEAETLQREEHNVQLQQINSQINDLQEKRANLENQRHQIIKALGQKVLNT